MPAEQSEAVSSRQGAWHQSTLSTIHDCPRRWYLTYRLGLPDPSGDAARIGTAIHKAVEIHEEGRRLGNAVTLDEMVDAAKAADTFEPEQIDMVAAGVRHWWKTPMRDRAVSHRDWLARLDVVAIEPYFNLPLVDGALPIGGWIDGVYRDPETGLYMIVDLKTSSSLSRWKASGDGKRYQATMYAVALQLGDILPEAIDYLPEMTYTVVKPGKGGECAKRVSVQPDLDDVRVLGQRIREAEAIVEAGEFPRNPAWVLCSATWCPHYQGCMVDGVLAGRPETVQQAIQNDRHRKDSPVSAVESPTVAVAITNRRNPA